MSYEEWDRLMRVNLDGVFNGVHAFLPHIKAHSEGGQIVSTSSILGLFTVGGRYGAYCASKFAAVAMMEALCVKLAESHIGVSAFCPGLVKSNLEAGIKDSPIAADPLEIGQLVLRGLRNNNLYILTHPEFELVIQQRFEALALQLEGQGDTTSARALRSWSQSVGGLFAQAGYLQLDARANDRTRSGVLRGKSVM